MSPAWALAALAAGLAGVIGLELRSQPNDDVTMPARQTRPSPAIPAGASLDGGAAPAVAAAILARPLFAPSRRPPAPETAAAAPPAPLPRVAGIMIDGPRRSVIFAGTDGSRPLVVGLGAEVAGFRVTAIEPGAVTVSGAQGARILRPSFDSRPAPAPAGPAPPNLQGLIGVPGLPATSSGSVPLGPSGLPPLPGLPGPPGTR